MSEITALFWLKDTYRFLELNAKGIIYGLTAKEVKDRDFRAQRLMYFLPMIGRALREKHFRDAEHEQFMRKYLHSMGLVPNMAKAAIPKMLQGLMKNRNGGGPITQPGILLKLQNMVSGRPQTVAPAPGVAPTEQQPQEGQQ